MQSGHFGRTGCILEIVRPTEHFPTFGLRKFSRIQIWVSWLPSAAAHRSKEGTEDRWARPVEETVYSSSSCPMCQTVFARMCLGRLLQGRLVLALWGERGDAIGNNVLPLMRVEPGLGVVRSCVRGSGGLLKGAYGLDVLDSESRTTNQEEGAGGPADGEVNSSWPRTA